MSIIPIFVVFLSVFILFTPLVIWNYEIRSCNKNNLFIEKVTYETGKKSFYIKKKTKLFIWFGPERYKYYEDIYDGNFSSHDSFSWIGGDSFEKYSDAKKVYDRLINYNVKIVKTEIYDENQIS